MTRRTLMAVAAVATVMVVGCGRDDAPSPPPTPSPEAVRSSALEPEEATDDPSQTVDVGVATESPLKTSMATSESPSDVEDQTEAAEVTQAPIPDGPPEMPDVALEDSQAGVDAFVNYFFAEWNYAATTGDVQTFDGLSTNACELCKEIAGQIVDFDERGIRTSAPPTKVQYTSTTLGDDGYLTYVSVIDGGYSLVNRSGERAGGPYEPLEFAVQMRVVEVEPGEKRVDLMIKIENE